MSNTDSFIDEVTEEVRRDKFYGALRRYGWLAGLVIVLIVGGAAWLEYRKSQERAEAEALGDGILASLSAETSMLRLSGLESVAAQTPGAQAVVGLLSAAEAQQAGETAAAIAALDAIAVDGDLPEIYRQTAAFKSLLLQAGTMEAGARRQQLAALAMPGAPFALLAQEQLGLMDIAEGQTNAAIERFQGILQDAGVTADLQQRALQVIVALGGTPELANLPELEN